MPEYLNFEIDITDLGTGAYLATVLDMPQVGEQPSLRFTLPFDETTIQRILLILSGKARPKTGAPEDAARRFGEQLFNMLFAGDIREAYKIALALARENKLKLRIRLNLHRSGLLNRLPWEFLRDPEIDYLVLSREMSLVHYTRNYVQPARIKAELPLRVLVMISAPVELQTIDEAAERSNLEQATDGLRQQGLVKIDYLENASLVTLQKYLHNDDYHVFHYIGHSSFDPTTGYGTIALENPPDHVHLVPIRGEALARELHEESCIQLVLLNSCQGAQLDERDPFSGIASSLVQRGIPAVIAMQFEISDRAAICFSETFYRRLAEGLSIEAAVTEGRRAVQAELNNLEWATPVLFIHEDDPRRIFDFSQEKGLKKWFSRSRTFQFWAGLVTLLLFTLIVAGLLGAFGTREDPEVIFIPPSPTPVPSVDLVVQDVRLSPRNPQPGDFVAVFVDIQNLGSDTSPAFNYEWQGNILDPNTIVTQRVRSISPGELLQSTITYRYGWWGTFITETRLDTGNEIIEPDERNNSLDPVRTDNTLPFIIRFDEPLPNGNPIRQTMPVPPGAYAAWGFELSAISDDPACAGVVPWFKFIGIGQIALGTGLPDNSDQCANATLIITLLERQDNNPAGVRSVTVDFGPGEGTRTLNVFSDRGLSALLGTFETFLSRREGGSVTSPTDITRFDRILSASIASTGGDLAITALRFTAP